MRVKLFSVLFCILYILLAQIALSDSEIAVTEGDIVSLSVVANDSDNDNLDFSYSSPLNKDGVWQTKYGDRGTYFVNVNVSDGKSVESENVKIVVLQKLFPPNITSFLPNELNLSINEGESILFSVSLEDIDSEKLYLTWRVDDKDVSSDLEYNFSTNFHSEGTHFVRFMVSDGSLSSQVLWKIIVKNINFPPEISIDELVVSEGDIVNLSFDRVDSDGDLVSYSLSNPIGDDRIWQTTFDDAGEYPILITASDGFIFVNKTILLTVKQKDRLPLITGYYPKENKLYAKEGESINFGVSVEDEDKDIISYSWSVDDVLVSDTKTLDYDLNFDSAGVKIVECSISDGILDTVKKWVLIVEDVNQAPIINMSDSYSFNEGEIVKIVPYGFDLDNDNITFSFSTPLNSNGEWVTNSDSRGVYLVNVSATDGKSLTVFPIKLTINKIDRAPIFVNHPSTIYVNEGDYLSIILNASDPDRDTILFSSDNLPNGSFISGNTLNWNVDFDVVKRHTGILGKFLNKLNIYKFIFSDNKNFKIKVIAESNNLSSSHILNIVVRDNNKVPSLLLPEKILAWENSPVKIGYVIDDLDNDSLIVTFSPPFNKKGTWTPGFDDSGEYTVNVNVNDGLNVTSKDVLVVVENVNRKPSLIVDDYIKISAGNTILIKPEVSDPDNDNLTVSFSGWINSSEYLTNENDSGIHTVTVSVSDNINVVSKDITVKVRSPSLFWYYAKFVLIGLLLLIIIIWFISKLDKGEEEDEDSDGDEPELEIEEIKEDDEANEDFDDAEMDNVVDDDFDTEPKKSKFKIVFALLILLIIAGLLAFVIFKSMNTDEVSLDKIKDVKVDENNMINIIFNAKNYDGLQIINLPKGSNIINTSLIWIPTFEQAGVYNISVVAFNNVSNVSRDFKIVVNDVNRLPNITSVTPSKHITIQVGKKVIFKVNASDLDKEDKNSLSYTWSFDSDKYQGNNSIARIFTIPGKKNVKVVVSDGKDSVTYAWVVDVTNKPSAKTAVVPAKTYVITEVYDIVSNTTTIKKDSKVSATTKTYVVYG